MWLYPGEEELFTDKEGFALCEAEGNHGQPMVICSGECDRRERPLACRIFPLFPLVTEEDGRVNIEVIMDPIDPSFARAVRRAAMYLVRDEEIKEYMKAVSLELLEIIELRERLG